MHSQPNPLPNEFLADMQSLLGSEYNEFIASYLEPKTMGLRVNTLKTTSQEFLDLNLFSLSPIPWSPAGYYINHATTQPGRHPLHHAGLYYLQEPSAMAAVPTLCPKPGDYVLDLCASPGGKSTHIANMLRGMGLLVANEYAGTRLKALGENIERWGIANAIITNSDSTKLAQALPDFFDKILIDAPCSGQAMFRKDPFAIADWSMAKVEQCCHIQAQLLQDAYYMLKPNGTIVYSTCSFSVEENEAMVEKFVKQNPTMEIVTTQRLWPHRVKGEGHFIAKLLKSSSPVKTHMHQSFRIPAPVDSLSSYYAFLKTCLKDHNDELTQNIKQWGEQLLLVPDFIPEMKGVHIVRIGLALGTIKKHGFEPAHALSHYLTQQQPKQSIDLPEPDAYLYLQGQTMKTGSDHGWVAVTTNGYILGWGKDVKGTLKNHYPKGLRTTCIPAHVCRTSF